MCKNQRFLKVFGVILGRLGAVLEPSWGRLGPSWGHLGAVLGRLGAILGRLGREDGYDRSFVMKDEGLRAKMYKHLRKTIGFSLTAVAIGF